MPPDIEDGDYWEDFVERPSVSPESDTELFRIFALEVSPNGPATWPKPDHPVPQELREWIPLTCQSDTGPHSYALLDAALIPNLPELLEMSGLQHRCLFKTEDTPALANVSPWIVSLEGDDRFVQNLFTKSSYPSHLWGSDGVIFLTSSAKLDDLWRMLRRFTRVSDERGRWYFWRFWDARVLLSFLGERDFSPMAQQFLQSHQRLSSATVFILPQENAVSLIELHRPRTELGAEESAMLTDQDRQKLRRELRQRDAIKLAGFLGTQPVLGKSDPAYLNDLALRSLVRRDQLGVRSANGVAWMVILLYLADRNPKAAKGLSRIMQSKTWQFDQIARMLKRRAEKTPGHDKDDI